MRNIPRSSGEKRVDSYGYRRERSVDKQPRFFRLAGEIFNTEKKERSRATAQESRRRLQSVRPVGLNFGEKDSYGPDNSWDTKDPITYTPYPSYYKGQKIYKWLDRNLQQAEDKK